MEFSDKPDEADMPDRGMQNLADDVRALSLQDQLPVHALPLEKKAENTSPASPLPVSTDYVQIILSENVLRLTYESVRSSSLITEVKIDNSEDPSERMQVLKLIMESALSEKAPTIHMRSRKGEKPFVFPEGWGRDYQKKGFHTLFEEKEDGKLNEDLNLSDVRKIYLRGLGMEGFKGMDSFYCLETLKLCECYEIDDDAIREELCRSRLKQLYITNCPRVSMIVMLSSDPISDTLKVLNAIFSRDQAPRSVVLLDRLARLRTVETNTCEIQGCSDLSAMLSFTLHVVDMNKAQLLYVVENLSELKMNKDKLSKLDLHGMNTLDWSKQCDVDQFFDAVNFVKCIGVQNPLHTQWRENPALKMYENKIDLL